VDPALPDTSRFVDDEFDALYTAHRDDIWRYLRRRAASEPEDLTTGTLLGTRSIGHEEVPGRDIGDWRLVLDTGRRDDAPQASR
jgi:hypothetical protein